MAKVLVGALVLVAIAVGTVMALRRGDDTGEHGSREYGNGA